MKEETIIDKIIEWYWLQMSKIMNYTLKHFGYDFGTYYMDEIEKMYKKNKHKIKKD